MPFIDYASADISVARSIGSRASGHAKLFESCMVGTCTGKASTSVQIP
jgi:hypothetical protein